MRFIKLGVISVVLLAVLITVISFLLPSTVVVRRAVEIKGNADSILNKVNRLQEWKNWLANPDTLPLVVSNASGKQLLTLGNTTVALVSTDTSSVYTAWSVQNTDTMRGYFTLIKHIDVPTITIQWDFEKYVGWAPWKKFASVAYDRALGPFMEQSLENLKQYTEAAQ